MAIFDQATFSTKTGLKFALPFKAPQAARKRQNTTGNPTGFNRKTPKRTREVRAVLVG
jgi:hypothetical protein